MGNDKWLREHGMKITLKLWVKRRWDEFRNNLGLNEGVPFKLHWSNVAAFMWNANVLWFNSWPRSAIHFVDRLFDWEE
jgi:hypothetical protein